MDKPIVGKIIHYYRETPELNRVNTDPGPDPEGQPLAAIITHILSVTDKDQPLYNKDPNFNPTRDPRDPNRDPNPRDIPRDPISGEPVSRDSILGGPGAIPRRDDGRPRETRVNLAVFAVNGEMYGRSNVLLVQEGVPPTGSRFAEWPERTEARKKAETDAKKDAEGDAKKEADAQAAADARAKAGPRDPQFGNRANL